MTCSRVSSSQLCWALATELLVILRSIYKPRASSDNHQRATWNGYVLTTYTNKKIFISILLHITSDTLFIEFKFQILQVWNVLFCWNSEIDFIPSFYCMYIYYCIRSFSSGVSLKKWINWLRNPHQQLTIVQLSGTCDSGWEKSWLLQGIQYLYLYIFQQ